MISSLLFFSQNEKKIIGYRKKEVQKNLIYMDNSATTALDNRVLDKMLPYLECCYGNASSSYLLGREARRVVEKARECVACCLNASPEEIYFTSGGSESDNMIIKGIAKANKEKGKHIITSCIEHLAVLNTCHSLEKEGFEVTYLEVNQEGLIDIQKLEESIRKDTILISIMFANNEIGTIQKVEEIAKIAKKHQVYFHTDAVQAIGNIEIDVKRLGIDAMSLSAHKFHGPKGIGASYIREGILFEPLIEGGHQEKEKRAGTENVAGIVGLAEALKLATSHIDVHRERIQMMRDYFYTRLRQITNSIKVNGTMKERLPGNLNICFPGIDNKNLLLIFDMNGICVSTGSACNSNATVPSHVLSAIGCSVEEANSSIRFTLGDDNTFDEVDRVVEIIKENLHRLK